MITRVIKSNKKDKKMTAILDNGKEIHFGSATSQTYVEGATKEKRDNYFRRHLANPVERHHVENLVMSPALLSAYVLWYTPDMNKNIDLLNANLKAKKL